MLVMAILLYASLDGSHTQLETGFFDEVNFRT